MPNRVVPALSEEPDGSLVLDVNGVMRLDPCAIPRQLCADAQTRCGPCISATLEITQEANVWGDPWKGRLTISACRADKPSENIVLQSINVTSRKCRFGGYRWYFLCPVTMRRCQKLYLTRTSVKGAAFASRKAQRIPHPVWNENKVARAQRKLDRLYGKVGQIYDGPSGPLITRPKGMWLTTFTKLKGEIDRAESRLQNAMNAGMRRGWQELMGS